MSAKHHRKGILTGLGKPGLQKKSKKKPSRLRTVLQWFGGGAVIVLFGVMVFAVGVRMLNPSVGERSFEGDYEIMEIRNDVSAVATETRAVAVALIQVRGQVAFVPITAQQHGTVQAGETIHVRYTTFPNLGLIRVDSWEKK